MDKPGYYQGRHYTAYGAQVISLINAGNNDLAEQLLLRLIEAVEAENEVEHEGVAPWYYKLLARIYRVRHNTPAERAIIARFNRQPYGSIRLFCPTPIQPAYALVAA